ncbi:unnamed protein product [Symbiodinium sp. CCMP2456]|nr:unnamed protein product [Symbiodinium sp. CCMP2456]
MPQIAGGPGSGNLDSTAASAKVVDTQQVIWTEMQVIMGHDFSNAANAAKVFFARCRRRSGSVRRDLSGFPALEPPSLCVRAGEAATAVQRIKSMVSERVYSLFVQLQDVNSRHIATQAFPDEEAVLDYLGQVLHELGAWAEQMPQIAGGPGSGNLDSTAASSKVVDTASNLDRDAGDHGT